MDPFSVFATVGILSLVAYIIFSIMIMRELEKRGIKTNVLLMRLLIIKWANQYKSITQEETGSPGSLFYGWLISINMALVCAVIVLIIKRIS
jgi:hypothetical protein